MLTSNVNISVNDENDPGGPPRGRHRGPEHRNGRKDGERRPRERGSRPGRRGRDDDLHVGYLRWLAESGREDVLTLRRETAERVLTDKRMEIVAAVAEDVPESVRDLARRLDRDVSIVSRDLDVLFEASVIDYERDGRAKRPVLTHENVFVEPVVFDGEVLEE